MNRRSSGVLLHISSLPGPFGIGVFGKEAEDFARLIRDCGFSKWQVLPLGPLDHGNSPYASDGAFAGNVLFIDPRELRRCGLITDEELSACEYRGTVYTVDYTFVKAARRTVLKQAYRRLTDRAPLDQFIRENPWVNGYALYLAVKEAHGDAPWWEWGEDSDFSHAQAHEADFDTDLHKFCQYEFFRQWTQLRKKINALGVQIIGDMPIYVALDSCDVWQRPDLFGIDPDTKRPVKVAGVPPDYFSADGQLWGNPVYDWDAMKREGFKWWISRISSAMTLYDTVRIDHFRGLASYWAVPADAASAKEGHWEKAPGKELFDAVFKALPAPSIIAEDLGVCGDDVTELLAYTGFAGMRVIQFAFTDPNDAECVHLPHNYPANCIAYLGTHDNNTLLGWLWEAPPAEKQFALSYCGFEGDNWGDGGMRAPACRKMIETVFRSHADCAIISLQDMCGFGRDARMNIPGIAELNWRYRASAQTMESFDREYFKKLNKLFGRN